MLYLIEILHQTTTVEPRCNTSEQLYLIEILHQTTTWSAVFEFLLLLYLIEILHQTTTSGSAAFNVSMLYLIEILHQTTTSRHNRLRKRLLYLIEILHQTTTLARPALFRPGCILSKFYIKPQLRLERELTRCVVSYRNSTSNHNSDAVSMTGVSLYLIEILHQTTTPLLLGVLPLPLYLIEILHQTTTPPRTRAYSL